MAKGKLDSDQSKKNSKNQSISQTGGAGTDQHQHQQRPRTGSSPDLPSRDESDEKLCDQLHHLEQQLQQAQERERRSLADYQNLLRRTRDERVKAIRLANQDLIESLLPAVENLDRAAAQIEDDGLGLVIDQLWSTLQQFGVNKIETEGKDYDVDTMEVVDRQGEGETVIAEVKPGYKLKNRVIQHAKVILGSKQAKE